MRLEHNVPAVMQLRRWRDGQHMCSDAMRDGLQWQGGL
jgi:hypothetical protein